MSEKKQNAPAYEGYDYSQTLQNFLDASIALEKAKKAAQERARQKSL